MAGIYICPECERRRALQLALRDCIRAAKKYKQQNNLDSVMICRNVETKEFVYCEVDDPRIGVALVPFEKIIL